MPLISIHHQMCMDASVSKSEGTGESGEFPEIAKEGPFTGPTKAIVSLGH